MGRVGEVRHDVDVGLRKHGGREASPHSRCVVPGVALGRQDSGPLFPVVWKPENPPRNSHN